MEFSEQALVLKVGRFREIDAWVRLVSPVRGIYTAFAFGGLKSRRRFLGCLDPLNQVRFMVRRSGRTGYHCLTEARLLASPTGLRHDPGRLGIAVNCLKFFEAVQSGPPGAAEAYALLRAVTPGSFTVPPAQAEAMYAPQLRASGPISKLTVTGPTN